jgi:RNA polymerase sigma-70 factor (ECF subfamily)
LSEAISDVNLGMQIQSGPTDVDLVQQAARGVSGAVRELYSRFSSMAYSLALRIGGNEADAEEVLVDAFFQVWKQAERYDTSRGTVAGWILNIVRSRAIDTVRSRMRVVRARQKMEEGEEEAPMASPPPNPERQAMVSQKSGLSQSEIAAELGQPLGTVKTRMRLGMQKLRRELLQEQES